MQIEICVDSVESALAADRGGADRIELCAGLGEGGTTPGAGSIQFVRENTGITLQVLVRPRGGDFLYTPAEQAVMREEIRIAKDQGADGIVIGCLTAAGDVDREQAEALIALSRPCSVTFHRAFDMCRDPRRALEQLVELGVDRVLTSGQQANCAAGTDLLKELHEQAAGRIIILPGGGITRDNAQAIVTATGVGEIHLTARSTVESRMQYRNPHCSMGDDEFCEEFHWKATDENIVREVIEAVRGGG